MRDFWKLLSEMGLLNVLQNEAVLRVPRRNRFDQVNKHREA